MDQKSFGSKEIWSLNKFRFKNLAQKGIIILKNRSKISNEKSLVSNSSLVTPWLEEEVFFDANLAIEGETMPPKTAPTIE